MRRASNADFVRTKYSRNGVLFYDENQEAVEMRCSKGRNG